MTNNIAQAAEYGFLKRAMEYGMTEVEARVLLKEKHAGLLEDVGAGINKMIPLDPSNYEGIQKKIQELAQAGGITGASLGGIGSGLGGLLGAGAGALGGHLMGGTDEEKSKRRWQGAALGGGLGAIGGGAAGGGIAGTFGTGIGLGGAAQDPNIGKFLNQTMFKQQ